MADACVAFLEYGEGEGDSAKSEMMVASSVKLRLQGALQKKDTFVTFWAEQKKLSHTYDTSRTIIVTKPGIIIDVVGSYFYDKKS